VFSKADSRTKCNELKTGWATTNDTKYTASNAKELRQRRSELNLAAAPPPSAVNCVAMPQRRATNLHKRTRKHASISANAATPASSIWPSGN
jgi:hypothetical protein